jgi:hypothetical protein
MMTVMARFSYTKSYSRLGRSHFPPFIHAVVLRRLQPWLSSLFDLSKVVTVILWNLTYIVPIT